MDEFIPSPTLLDECVRYGLYLGAVFQLVCIAAIFVSMSSDEGKGDHSSCESSDDELSEQCGVRTSSMAATNANKTSAHHRKRNERKKRR